MKNEGWDVYAICSRGSNSKDLTDKGYNLINVEIPRNLNPVLIIKTITSTIIFYQSSMMSIVYYTHT